MLHTAGCTLELALHTTLAPQFTLNTDHNAHFTPPSQGPHCLLQPEPAAGDFPDAAPGSQGGDTGSVYCTLCIVHPLLCIVHIAPFVVHCA